MAKTDLNTWIRRPSLPTVALIAVGVIIIRLRFSDVYKDIASLLTSESPSIYVQPSRLVSKNSSTEVRQEGVSPSSVKCIVYDRPMRTASTTITASLQKCFSDLGWSVDRHHLGNNRSHCIELEFQRKRSPYAMVKGHKWLTSSGVQLLRTKCTHFAYITSTAPLWEQIWSAAKMLSNVRRNGNSTLDSKKREVALDWVDKNGREYARMYEYYPHIRLTEPLEIQSDGRYPDIPPAFERDRIEPELIPDYVIRKYFLKEDLSLLLATLGCPSAIEEAKNVHAIISDGGKVENDETYREEVMQLAGVSDGETYSKLVRQAEQNSRGLDHIRKVMEA